MSVRAVVLAPAKVNLTLRVLGRRPDGFHDIDTLFQAIDLCDEVVVELGGAGGVGHAAVELDVSGPDLGPPEENLAFRAAVGFLSATGQDAGVRVHLTKRIPVGAGLGGGSSDAAAVLRALDLLHGGVDDEGLRGIAAELGSDVPFFLGGSTLARGTGRGEVLEPLAPLPTAAMVLVSPPVHVSTAAAYGALAEARVSSGAPGRASRSPSSAGDVAAGSDSATRLDDWASLARIAHNDFESVMTAKHAELPRALDALRSAGASVALMTGSGSTCFGLFPGTDDAVAAAERVGAATGWSSVAVQTLEAFPEVRRG